MPYPTSTPTTPRRRWPRLLRTYRVLAVYTVALAVLAGFVLAEAWQAGLPVQP